jgi:hypothetical protein
MGLDIIGIVITSRLSLSLSLFPYPPQQRSQRGTREEEDMVAIALASTQCHRHGEEGRVEQARRGFVLLPSIISMFVAVVLHQH